MAHLGHFSLVFVNVVVDVFLLLPPPLVFGNNRQT